MNWRLIAPVITAGLVLGLAAAPVQAAGPEHHSGSWTDTLDPDGLFLDLCGIETRTTFTERWSVTDFADGTRILNVTRVYVPEDPRLPIERGAGTSIFAPDGTQTVFGKPIQLFHPDGGVMLMDAGLVSFGDELVIHGPHPSLAADLAEYYCN